MTNTNNPLLFKVMSLLSNINNINPLSVAQKGIRSPSSFRFQAQDLVSVAKVDIFADLQFEEQIYQIISDNSFIKTNKNSMAIIIFESLYQQQATDETKAFLKRISTTGVTLSPEDVPEQLKQFL